MGIRTTCCWWCCCCRFSSVRCVAYSSMRLALPTEGTPGSKAAYGAKALLLMAGGRRA
jgi:hypothetical protein